MNILQTVSADIQHMAKNNGQLPSEFFTPEMKDYINLLFAKKKTEANGDDESALVLTKRALSRRPYWSAISSTIQLIIIAGLATMFLPQPFPSLIVVGFGAISLLTIVGILKATDAGAVYAETLVKKDSPRENHTDPNHPTPDEP